MAQRACATLPEIGGRDDRSDKSAKEREILPALCGDEGVARFPLILCRPLLAISTVSCLAGLGLRIPRDVSIVAREYNPAIHDAIWASLASFRIDTVGFSRRLLALFRKVFEGEGVPQQQTFFIPDLHSADSLAPAPAGQRAPRTPPPI